MTKKGVKEQFFFLKSRFFMKIFVRKRAIMLYVRDFRQWRQRKERKLGLKKSSKILGGKMEIFVLKKGHSKICMGLKIFSVPQSRRQASANAYAHIIINNNTNNFQSFF